MKCRKCGHEKTELFNDEWECFYCATHEFKIALHKVFPFKQLRKIKKWLRRRKK